MTRVSHQTEYLRFNNIGFAGKGRAFPGFPVKSDAFHWTLAPRDAVKIDVKVDDILSLLPSCAEQSVSILAFHPNGRCDPGLLGLPVGLQVDLQSFNCAAFTGWVAGNGAPTDADFAVATVFLEDLVALKARATGTVWIIHPQPAEELVAAAGIGTVGVALKAAGAGRQAPLPPAIGHVRDEFTVRRGTALAYELQPGEIVQIIDVEGQQCSDFMALRKDALEKGREIGIDGTATRTMVHGAYPDPGLLDKFYDPELRPILRTVQDTCGRHDMFGMACTARGY